MRALTKLQTKLLNFATKYQGWHSIVHSEIRTARSLAKKGFIELQEYPKEGRTKPYAQFKLNH